MTKSLLTIILTSLIATTTAVAVPSLQLYLPGGVYDMSAEAWRTSETDFELWVVAANLNHGAIYDISLVAALMDGQMPLDGALTITPEGGSAVTFNAADYTNGSAPPVSDPLPDHGIYPTQWVEMAVASMTTPGPFEPVQDYVPGGDGGTSLYGQIFKFHVTTTYEFVNFDAYGFFDGPDGQRIKAPFSHSAQTMVPEPATLLLVGLGLAGAGIIRKIRR